MQSGNKIWPVYAVLQNIFFYQKILRKILPGKKLQALFNFQRILYEKDSVEASMLIWTNFDRLAITYLI